MIHLDLALLQSHLTLSNVVSAVCQRGFNALAEAWPPAAMDTDNILMGWDQPVQVAACGVDAN